MKQKVNIIDNAFAHIKYCGGTYHDCPWLEWNRVIPVDSNELVIVTELNVTFTQIYNSTNIKYAWLLECRELSPTPYKWLLQNYSYYKNVLTHDKELLKLIPNALWQPLGGCWVSEEDCSIDYNKTKLISSIISHKNFMSGHNLRHKVFNNVREIDYFGNYIKHIENKIEALRDYKYHLCIENSKLPGYFTEKLIDCFATGCIPIYWGDPLIGEVFDTSGMIIVNSYDDIMNIINKLDKIDYESFRSGIINNFKICKNYVQPENYMYINHNHIFKS